VTLFSDQPLPTILWGAFPGLEQPCSTSRLPCEQHAVCCYTNSRNRGTSDKSALLSEPFHEEPSHKGKKKRKKKRKEKGKRRKGKRRKRKVQKTVGYTEVCRHKTAFALSISTTCTLGVQPLSLLVFPRLHGKPGLS